MEFRRLDPNDAKAKPSMPFLVEFDGGAALGEADSPAGLVALLVGPEYADAEDEEVAWHLRVEYAESQALWLHALTGRPVVVADGSLPGPVFAAGDPGAPPAAEIRVDGDWALVASLHNAGAIALREGEDVAAFRGGGAAPRACRECGYFRGGWCRQFDLPVGPDAADCLDGIALPAGVLAARRGRTYMGVGRIAVPPERLKGGPRGGGRA